MRDLLCAFAHQFPDLAAEILYRDRHKRRNFREESITDLLMAGLTAFEPFGIIVDFPADESKTGEDMDWEFVDPQAPDRRRYLRLHIQAKRAICRDSKKNPYWFYRELDHAAPLGAFKGSQHKSLLDNAAKTPGCVPLYMFYHPRDALTPKTAKLPAVEGVNVMFAEHIPRRLTPTQWPAVDKKIEKWRPYFMPLSSLLCFGRDTPYFVGLSDGRIEFLIRSSLRFVSPGELADRLNGLWPEDKGFDSGVIRAIETIPPSTMRALEPDPITRHTAEIERPRVIFLTQRAE